MSAQTLKTDVTIIQSSGAAQAAPMLSVLVPYYHDDPTELLTDLVAQTSGDIELLFYDDGTGDQELNAQLTTYVEEQSLSVTLMIAAQNRGRSAARNALQMAAKADWVLFLDADMRPSSHDFLNQYKKAIAVNDCDIIFGGFKVPDSADTPEQKLHGALSRVSDCLPLKDRKAAGAQFVASSNLCVRKSVLSEEPFDSGFKGWGWEDSEWAARAAARYTLMHIDNPALHLGLETDATLLSRFKNSAQNYIRFTRKHPDLAQTLALYRLSTKLSHIPGQGILRPLYKALVLIRPLPMRLRILGLKLWRASWYGSAFAKGGRNA